MRVVAAVALGLMLALGPVTGARAHEPVEPGTMLIEFLLPPTPVEDLDAFFGDGFGIFADGERCLTFRLRDAGWTAYGDHVGNGFVIGREQQPEACRREGATLTFGNGDRWLFVTATLELDTLLVVENYAAGQPPSTGEAQQPPAEIEPPRPGDFTWWLRRTGPLADVRLVVALAILVDEAAVLESAGLPGERLVYADLDVLASEQGAPLAEAELLLAASGFGAPGEPAQLRQTRRCRTWTPPGLDAEPERRAIADALARAIAEALLRLGVVAEPCEATVASIEADVFVSRFGLGLGGFSEPSGGLQVAGFLEATNVGPPPSGPGTPTPPRSGDAGVAAPSAPPTAATASSLGVTALLLLAARLATARRGERR